MGIGGCVTDLGLVVVMTARLSGPREADRSEEGLARTGSTTWSPSGPRRSATEVSQALLAKTHRWKQAPVDGHIRNLYTLHVGEPAGKAGHPDHREELAVHDSG